MKSIHILVCILVLSVVAMVGCGKEASFSSPGPEATHSVKCTSPDCNYEQAAMPDTPFKTLMRDESGHIECPDCHKMTLKEMAASKAE